MIAGIIDDGKDTVVVWFHACVMFSISYSYHHCCRSTQLLIIKRNSENKWNITDHIHKNNPVLSSCFVERQLVTFHAVQSLASLNCHQVIIFSI